MEELSDPRNTGRENDFEARKQGIAAALRSLADKIETGQVEVEAYQSIFLDRDAEKTKAIGSVHWNLSPHGVFVVAYSLARSGAPETATAIGFGLNGS